MNKWIVALAVAVPLTLAGCGSAHGNGRPVAAPTAVGPDYSDRYDPWAATAGYPYPAAAEQLFRATFAAHATSGECALAATEREYSYDDFLAVSHAYAGTGELPPAIRAIIVACVAQAQ